MDTAPLSTRRTVFAGLAGLAAAMGIGRFAFTPLLPLMQADGLTLSQGAWLAGANYLGYLAGALLCAGWDTAPARAARAGLLGVALTTLLMAASPGFVAALVLRAAAGVASAFVLIGVSAWALPLLATRGRADASGIVYAGVGIGMVVAGVAALAIGVAGEPATAGWAWLGGIAVVACVATWRTFQPVPITARPTSSAASAPPARSSTALIACYGAFGFGYIVPATFLPAMAREAIANPALFGWIWPLFGLAAALSTLIGGVLSRRIAPRLLWAASQGVMALGVLLPAAAPHSAAALVASAIAVGGTFMVATMAGLQEARRVAGPAAPRLMAAMTAAFGTGQVLGPLAIVAAGAAGHGPLAIAIVAALSLLVSAAVLLAGAPHAASTVPPATPGASS